MSLSSLIERIGPGPAAGDHDIELDELFDALSNSRRRAVIEFFRGKDPGSVVEMRKISREIVASDAEAGPDYGSREYKSVYSALYQHHVPKLVELGVIESNRESGMGSYYAELGRGPAFDVYVSVIDAAVDLTGSDQS